jgi:hypothetical protein
VTAAALAIGGGLARVPQDGCLSPSRASVGRTSMPVVVLAAAAIGVVTSLW